MPRRRSSRRSDVKLKDPKDWKIAGKRLKRLDTARQGQRQRWSTASTSSCPACWSPRSRDCPVVRRQGEELRRRQGRRHAGREEGGAGRRLCGVAVVADTWWRAHKALEALPVVWDPGEAGKVSSATIAEVPRRAGSMPSRRSSATRPATPRPTLAGAKRRDRGGVQLSPTRTTPPWSR